MLKIVDLKGNHLASIHQEGGSNLRIEIIDESLRQELDTFFKRILSEKVYLVRGTRETKDRQVIHQTVRKQVQPGDPDFLKGVQDMITRTRLRLGGQRVRALLIGKEQQRDE